MKEITMIVNMSNDELELDLNALNRYMNEVERIKVINFLAKKDHYAIRNMSDYPDYVVDGAIRDFWRVIGECAALCLLVPHCAEKYHGQSQQLIRDIADSVISGEYLARFLSDDFSSKN